MKTIWKNEKGSALVSVIVVIAFISILATTMLYISGTNYQLKMADNKSKVSFYQTEEPVDQLRADVVRIVAETEKQIYPEMMTSIGARINDQDLELYYKNLFFNTLEKKLETYKNGLNAADYPEKDAFIWTRDTASDCYRIENIVVKQKNANGYTSIISTDIVIEAPKMEWPYKTAEKDGSGNFGPQTVNAGEKVDYFKCVYYSNWVKK